MIFPSAIIRSPGFMLAGQAPRYLASMITTVSTLPAFKCISVCDAVSPWFV